jgi:hypothetical protein
MKDDQHRFLSLLGQLPARLTVEQAGWVLGCQPHDVPVLVSYRLLKPLGNPPPNGIKFFAAADVLDWSRIGRGSPKLQTPSISIGTRKTPARKAIPLTARKTGAPAQAIWLK